MDLPMELAAGNEGIEATMHGKVCTISRTVQGSSNLCVNIKKRS